MYVASQGVDASALSQGAGLLARPAEEYINDANVETAWVVKACQYADIHYNLISSVDPKLLRLTQDDDRIYGEFMRSFPTAKVDTISENELKSPSSKEAWRKFLEALKDIPDYNFGTLLRLDSKKDYSEENTTLVPRLQFLAIEIARNRKGYNDSVWINSLPDLTNSQEGGSS